MTISKVFYLSLAAAGCAAAAYAIRGYARHVDRREFKEGLRNWEDEGGNLSPSETGAMERLAPGPDRTAILE